MTGWSCLISMASGTVREYPQKWPEICYLLTYPHKLDPEILIISKPTMHGWIYSLPPGPRVEKIRHKMGVGHMCFFSSATKPCWFVKPI